MWGASVHSKALGLIIKNERAASDCYGCHSAEGFAAKLQCKRIDIIKKESFNTPTCGASHAGRKAAAKGDAS